MDLASVALSPAPPPGRPPAPPPLDRTDRPAFADWIVRRALSFVAVGAVLGVGPQQVRHYCRRWDDPKRQKPREDVLERIVGWTLSEITAEDFFPPHLRAPSARASSIDETVPGGVA